MKISRKLITIILLLPCAAFGWPSSGGGVSSTSSNKVGLGTALAPAILFGASSDTGLYSPGTNLLALPALNRVLLGGAVDDTTSTLQLSNGTSSTSTPLAITNSGTGFSLFASSLNNPIVFKMLPVTSACCANQWTQTWSNGEYIINNADTGNILTMDYAGNTTFFGSLTSASKAGLTPIAITVGASPFAYTATATGSVAVSGGAVTNMTLTRGGTVVWNTTLSSDVIPVTLNDVVTVTYTTAPTMNELPN